MVLTSSPMSPEELAAENEILHSRIKKITDTANRLLAACPEGFYIINNHKTHNNMNSLTPSEIARVFSIYMDAAKVRHNERDYLLCGVSLYYCMVEIADSYEDVDADSVEFKDCKLLLRPLSALTEGLAVKVMALPDDVEVLRVGRDDKCVWVEYRWINPETDLNNPDGYSYSGASFYFSGPHSADEFQCLVQAGYAVPLFPWNKTAIELGLAIDASALE